MFIGRNPRIQTYWLPPVAERALASLQHRYGPPAMLRARQGGLPGPHAFQEVSRLDLQRFLKIDSGQKDIASPVKQLVIAEVVIVHTLAGPWHPVDTLVQNRNLVVADIVVHDHLPAP